MGRIDRNTELLYGDEVLTLPGPPTPSQLTGQRGTVIDTDYQGSGLVLVALRVSFQVIPGGNVTDTEPHHSKYFTFEPRELYRESRSILHELPESDRERYK